MEDTRTDIKYPKFLKAGARNRKGEDFQFCMHMGWPKLAEEGSSCKPFALS